MKYAPLDAAAVATKRADEIASGRALRPNLLCHYCGFTVGPGALWCCTGCAQDYMAERAAASIAST